MKIAVTGSNGQLGTDIVNVLNSEGYEVIALTHADFDIADHAAAKSFLENEKPDVFINPAAFHNVDKCEEMPEEAMLFNCTAPAQLAATCKQLGIKFIHFSTDYVFDGAKGAPYLESDLPAPLNNYGRSKYAGEQAILQANEKALIIRVSAIYGQAPCRAKGGLNFVQIMLKLAKERGEVKVVTDEVVSPTSTLSIAKALPGIIAADLSGIAHLTSEGSCNWHDFAREIFDYTNTQVKLYPATSADFPAKTPRPKYSVLENGALKSAGLADMPHWRDALHEYLDGMTAGMP